MSKVTTTIMQHTKSYHEKFSSLFVIIVIFNIMVTYTIATGTKCATLYNGFSYQGSPISFENGHKSPYRHLSYIPQSVRVMPDCVLTIFDNYGYKQTLDRDYENLGWSHYRALDAVCCECGGCVDAATKLGTNCARLFQNHRCDSCSGYHLDMKIGDEAKNFGILDNKMTSVAVRPGCTLTVFHETNFSGWRFNFTQSNNMMGENWYQQISSAKCGCGTSSGYTERPPSTGLPIIYPTYPTVPTTRFTITLPTVPTTRPPMTLPTVPTTRPPMTLPTVPTTRPPMTLPTVPTTRPPMTLPTVPTTRAPITLPTVPTTLPPTTRPTTPTTTTENDSDYSNEPDYPSEEDDLFFGSDKSPEIETQTTTTTTTTENYGESVWGFGNGEEEDEEEEEEEEKEEEENDWDDW